MILLVSNLKICLGFQNLVVDINGKKKELSSFKIKSNLN